MSSPETPGTAAVAELARCIVSLPAGEGRRLIAVAGAPASGQSEKAKIIADAMNGAGRARADVLGDAPRIAIEAAGPFGWTRCVAPEGDVIGVRGYRRFSSG